MSDITAVIARNLADLRKEKHMTLQDLADLTGVSKSMLGEIERASSNPTITVLWKITTGLKVPISRLVHDQKPVCQLIREKECRILRDLPGKIRLIFECDYTRNFEVYQMEFEPGTVHSSGSHDLGVVEYLMVYEGEFTMTIGGVAHVLSAGDSMFFEATYAHVYSCSGDSVAKAFSIIYYGQN